MGKYIRKVHKFMEIIEKMGKSKSEYENGGGRWLLP
jgi:hypothetical protein